jgi:Tol biopolymer transport system component
MMPPTKGAPMRSIAIHVLIVAATVTIMLLASLPASATYAGANGEIVYGTDTGVRAMSPDGSGDHLFSSLGGSIEDVSFSSDGTKAAVLNYNGRGDRIVLLDLVNDTRTVVFPVHRPPQVQGALSSVALSPRAHRIVFSDGTFPRHLWTIHTDGSKLTKIADGYGDPDWGSNGRIVASNGIFHGDGKRKIATMDPDGGNRTVLATFPPTNESWDTVYELVPSWAPDASAVVFAAQRLRITPDIWWVGADGSDPHKLTDTFSTSESGPVFSPDGTEIVFSLTDPPANSDLWLMDPDGMNTTKLTDTPARGEYPIAWQPVKT